MQAGLQLFAERPVDAVPIDEIVSAAAVGKGTFFNHFNDKHTFAQEISAEIRLDLELRIATTNAHVSDPIDRMAGGMVIAVDYALTQPQRTIVMARGAALATARNHPLNTGLRSDIEAALATRSICAEAESTGLLLWLGACQALMVDTVEGQFSRAQAALGMHDMMVIVLTGLGINSAKVAKIAVKSRDMLLEMQKMSNTGRLHCQQASPSEIGTLFKNPG